MKPTLKLVLFASAYALASATLVMAQQRDHSKVIDMKPSIQLGAIWQCEEDMHEEYVRRFEKSDGLGLSRIPQPLMLYRSGVLLLSGKRYSIEQLELVGLQDRTEPVAYVATTHKLPFSPADFQSRALTQFEQRALKELRKGRTVERSTGGDGDTLNIVGALRGDGTCLKCHKTAKEGDLLGAFTYRLRRIEGQD